MAAPQSTSEVALASRVGAGRDAPPQSRSAHEARSASQAGILGVRPVARGAPVPILL